ncbi:response regulator transcription factor [Mucilaginibacter rubeus]|uniref:Response regulator transcription factor n=1 Tax=Mucilaginibacter rubeus TaxID=2027860 RepID=A0AAE6JIX4_9SPHI|nr:MULTISPECIES: response regulator transcription factor [Mucilaginibacter]QEM06627.1 response regulator transcription factor [Mucilaginibacter rubeus]QEM19216.1 response regulator transcription factor [Mucilaginibacter gossypii]QTE44240.1 response regulator transcription factor [Mucilaginibacter rubeus]QTE50840.1 response regulator transcription factor [Mucilaginibacter rubeus]QTE55922.1 response regulator transcription factor [Mucilaginibacter rubeus]
MKILIVEDEPELSGSIASYLLKETYRCEIAADFAQAEDMIVDFQYDCVIVDIGLPGGSGLELIKLIKSMKRNDGIIVISANSALNDKLTGLNLGADDYLAKPFHLSELSARLNSVIRRRNFQGSSSFVFKELQVNVDDKSVLVHGKPLTLNKKELDLLLFLVANKNRIVSKSAIAEHLSQNESGYYRGQDVVYAHMKNLKKKLTEAGSKDYIKTIYGVGYKFECYEAAD